MIEQDQQEQALAKLRDKIEEAVGRKMKTPKDFDFLSEQVFEKLHETVSATTLKRIWGYLPDSSKPRISTLDILALFVGEKDWDTFCSQKEGASSDSPAKPKPESEKKSSRTLYYIGAFIFVILIVCGGWLLGRYSKQPEPERAIYMVPGERVLKMGVRFRSPTEYLALFGIHLTGDSLWGKALPGLPDVWAWGPRYHHPKWHNDGDSLQLLPTISEHWDGPGVTEEAANARGKARYYLYRRINELRLAFVKNLRDTDYVFTGVYTMDIEQSDTSKIVWRRVATDVNLDRLDLLDSLRVKQPCTPL